jgi:hypothetical protein
MTTRYRGQKITARQKFKIGDRVKNTISNEYFTVLGFYRGSVFSVKVRRETSGVVSRASSILLDRAVQPELEAYIDIDWDGITSATRPAKLNWFRRTAEYVRNRFMTLLDYIGRSPVS